jgi:hypothetical protein
VHLCDTGSSGVFVGQGLFTPKVKHCHDFAKLNQLLSVLFLVIYCHIFVLQEHLPLGIQRNTLE